LSFVRSAPPRIGSRSWLAASSAAIALLLVTLVSSAAAVSGPTKLLNAGVSPRSGSPTTSITFTVTYRNRYGDAPVYVRVLVDGVARSMRVADSALDYHGGVRYRLATTLGLGTHQIAFTASDARKFSDTVQAGTVTIARASTGGSGASGGLAMLGVAAGLSVEQRMFVTAISTTTTTVAVMAFLFFGKRRRDGEPPAPDEELASNAALMTAVPTASVAQPHGGLPSGVEPDEAGMPRWRRPSLMAARKSDPLRAEFTIAKLSFDDGAVDALEGRERRRIKYRVVRLLDAPDELRSREIGLLDEGDEVQLLERSGSFWRVHCPDGSQGWVHRMTLGDIVDVSAGGRADRSFADATDDIDSDVLAAYLRVNGIS